MKGGREKTLELGRALDPITDRNQVLALSQ